MEKSLDEYGRSPLHYICIDNPDKDWVSISKKEIGGGHDINAQDENGWTPLHFAVQEGSIEVVRLLIESGANIHMKNDDGNTPLWVATMNSLKSLEIVKLLVDLGSDPNEKNNYDISPSDIEPELFNKP